ncbi:MAG: AmmeMemoRadiSam system protein A, partial [Bacilli bacterium]|nr:AmmeMemoRadiSam system protein A [Bacilli bacterium]
ILREKVEYFARKAEIPAGTLGEKSGELDHGTMIPLYFINKYLKNFKVLRISLSGLSPTTHYQLGKCLAQAITEVDERVVIISSGDLSHKLRREGPYGFAKEGPIFDKEITEAMASGDFLKFLCFNEDFCTRAAECGLRSFIIMAGALDGKAVKADLLSYEGPYGVGYAVATYDIIGDDSNRHFDRIFLEEEEKRLIDIRNREDPYVSLARQSLEYYINNKKILKCPSNLIDDMIKKKAGVFVSIKKEGNLRGCVGTISPTRANIALEIIANAISAGINDYRFETVTKEELGKLVYSVDVLGKMELVNSLKELNVKRYGIIVRSQGRSGLLLPNLEGIDSIDDQVRIALQKARIHEDEKYQIERFEVIRHR